MDLPDVPFTDRLDDFYSPGVSLARLKSQTAQTGPSDLLLRALAPPPIKIRHIPVLDLLRPAYRKLSEWEG